MVKFSAIHIRAGSICAVFSILFFHATAQPQKILFDHYSAEQGLSNNVVWEICKSRKGYLWIGTQDGLNRFDGKNFRAFRYAANDSNTLSNNTVYKLYEDDAGYLWIGTFSGLNRYNPSNNEMKRIKAGKYLSQLTNSYGVGAIAQSKGDYSVWVGSRGLYFVNQKTETLEPARGKINDDLFKADGNISSLLIENDNRIWIGSDKGLILYNRLDGTYNVYYTPQKSLINGSKDYLINKIMLDKKGRLWASTWGLGLLEFDTAQKKFTEQYLFEKNDGFKGGTNIIYSLAQTDFPEQQDIIWLACNEASFTAFNTQTKKFTHYRSDKPDNRNGVYGNSFSLFFDHYDGLWIGGKKGLYRYDKKMQFFNEHKFNYDFKGACLSYVFDAYADPADSTGRTVWAGTWTCGLFKYNPESREFSKLPDWLISKLKSEIPYRVVLRDSKGIIWAGTGGDGLLAIDEKRKSVTRFYPPGAAAASVNTITFLQEDSEGKLWTGTPAGLFVLDAERKNFDKIKWHVADSMRNKLSGSINGLCLDKNGNTWFTAQNGFNEALPVIGMIKKNSFEANIFYHSLEDRSSFPDVKFVRNITCDDNNTLWCASWNGLVSWKATDKKPSFKIYTNSEGLLNNFINSVEADNAGNIWCGTISGLSVLMNAGNKFRNFNNAGLEQDNVDRIFFNPQQQSLMIADWGGLHIIRPGDVAAASAAPRVTITDFRVFNNPAPEVKKYNFDSSIISLASNRNVVTIDFAALSFYNPSQIRYAYKMDGVDKDWIQTTNNSVTYILNNGRYVFHVKAMNAEGVWNEEGSFMEIIIRSPFWKKAWFITLMALSLTALLFSIYKYRVNQLKKLMTIRNNISQNLHDDIGSSLSNINILNELARRNIGDAEKSKEYLAKSGEDIQRISESLSDIVWNINPRYDDLQNLFIRMKRYAADMMDGKNISYQLEFPEEMERISMPMEKRRDMYLIFKEAVNNLVKYSKATEAQVLVKTDKRKILLSVKDNGTGFDSNGVQYGNGIINMRQRAMACDATLEINSRPGSGTEVKLELHTT